MRTTYIVMITAGIVLSGCSGFSFAPSHQAPKTEYDKRIYEQQNALEQQQRSMLNAYHT